MVTSTEVIILVTPIFFHAMSNYDRSTSNEVVSERAEGPPFVTLAVTSNGRVCPPMVNAPERRTDSRPSADNPVAS